MADPVEKPSPEELAYEPVKPAADEAVPYARTLVTGFLMGTANLVPGLSGGTMVLATGLYDRFVVATADITRLHLRRASVLFIVLLFGAKFAAMGLLGETVAETVAAYRTIAYALFLGMTLAGTPILWKTIRTAAGGKVPAITWPWAALGVAMMVALAFVPGEDKAQHSAAAVDAGVLDVEGEEPSATPDYVPTQNIPLDTAVGAAAYAAMVLPGVSGGTIKLALGRYEPTVWAIGQAGNFVNPAVEAAPTGQWLPILLPYTLGAIVGLVAVSNALKWLLRRHPVATGAVLLGVLWGSVVPVWPFTSETTPLGYLAGVGAALLGYALIWTIARLTPDKPKKRAAA